MPVTFEKNQVIFSNAVAVEDAEVLLEWLQKKVQVNVDFSACTHLHAANLQVLMAANITVAAWPADARFSTWLQAALPTSKSLNPF